MALNHDLGRVHLGRGPGLTHLLLRIGLGLPRAVLVRAGGASRCGCTTLLLVAPTGAQLTVDAGMKSLSFPAELQAERFRASLPPDHQYHALVHRGGTAAGQALFVTEVADTTVARVLRELGAEDGGGVPMASWNLRWIPFVPQPNRRVQGTRIEVRIAWEGSAREYALEELLVDPGAEGVELRFGGNEHQNHHWESGCIVCLFSCPGGVVSNAAYSIRDHQRGVTSFQPAEVLPPDGTTVTIVLSLVPT